MSDQASAQFSCERHLAGTGHARVVVVGEIDVATSPRLRRVLRDAQDAARHVVLDLGDTTFIDAGGIRVLLAAQERADATGASFAIARPVAQVARILRLVGAHVAPQEPDVAGPSAPPGRAGAGDGSPAEHPQQAIPAPSLLRA